MSAALAPLLTCDGAGCYAQLLGVKLQQVCELRALAAVDGWLSGRQQAGRRWRLVDLCPICRDVPRPPGARVIPLRRQHTGPDVRRERRRERINRP